MSLCHNYSAAPPSTGLYFMLRGNVYLPGDTVNITDIGVVNGSEPNGTGGALVCVTTNINTKCCRTRDGGNLGEWYFPNGTIVPRGYWSNRSDFIRSGSTQQVRLNNINGAISPRGDYECRVPDISGILHTATITMGELYIIRPKMHI